MTPTAGDVAAFLGRDDPATVALAGEHLPVVAAMVKAYVRGRGFDLLTGEPADDLAAVIIASAARLAANPEHRVSEQVDDYAIRPGVFNGWTLPELAILHRYRRRTM